MSIYERDFRINYIDVNENNELTTRGFIKFMQEIAGEHSNSVGFGLDNLLKVNMAWIILNWNVKVFKRPNCDDVITIKTWVRGFDKIYSFRDFEVYDKDNNLIAIASSKWVLKNHSSHTIVRISPEIVEAYDCVSKCVFDYDLDNKVIIPDIIDSCYEYVVQRRDIDTNHHVNNLYYIDFAYEALPDEIFNDCSLNCVQVFYKKEIKYKEKIVCCYSFVDNEHIVVIKNEDLSKVHAVIKFFKN